MYEEIFQEVKSILEETQNYDFSIKDNIIQELKEKWYKNKKEYIDKLGGLIYTIPVAFELPEDIKEKRVEEFCNYCLSHFPEHKDFLTFVFKSKKYFYENHIPYDYDKNIPKGAKISKAFRKFDLKEEDVRFLQDKLSMMIQDNKLSGYLSFSVHPLDFLTISENNSGWSSCHALNDMYRLGPLSYMLDSSTIVCYFHQGEKQRILGFKSFEWNDKQWRVLIHFSNTRRVAILGRQYPFNIVNILESIKGILDAKFFTEETKIFSQYNLDIDVNYHGRGFNDLIHSEKYKFPTLIGKNDIDDCFDIGASVPCLQCGEYMYPSDEEYAYTYSMLCDDCELKYGTGEDSRIDTCSYCGGLFDTENEDYVFINDEVFCLKCVENEVVAMCKSCYEWYYSEDLNEHGLCHWCSMEEENYYG